jgi:hypothetical protein
VVSSSSRGFGGTGTMRGGGGVEGIGGLRLAKALGDEGG